MPKAKIFFLLLFYSLTLPSFSLSQSTTDSFYESTQRRDPFIPLIDEKANFRKIFKKPQYSELPVKISLTGICEVKGVLYAIIEGELYKEGDICGEFKITKVEPERVILSIANKEFELTWEGK